MQNKLPSLFGTLSEPVIASKSGEIIYRNTIASHSHIFAKAALSELVPELALSCEIDNFITETVLNDEKYTISGTVFDDITIYIFRSMNAGHQMQMTDIIASVSLSLRDPLSIMNIAADHLLPFAEEQNDARLSEYASMMRRGLFIILRSLNRLDALVFLAGGMPAASERTVVDLVQLARDLVRTISQILELDEDRLRMVAESDEANVLGDRRLIERMLLCLIGNALIFTDMSSQIKITVRMRDDKALIYVSDTGDGISDDARFDVWSRYGAWRDLDDTKRGAGFGLSVVQAIARAHSGGALIESRPGSGTNVIVSLAATPEDDIVPIFESPQEYSTVNDMREIFAELVNIIPKEKFATKYMD
ncbi:MAG: HAMP domain-containing histidine kinase [Clostridiales bacterium]|nr:HAMP domain-containing histidine kinase [Clostridiales bacterium]